MPAPTFERVRKIFELADRNLSTAQNAQDLDIKDEAYRDAFNKLFDIARNAVMAYLSSDETRWGQLRRALPGPFAARFREIINTLHIDYAYEGGYPAGNTDEAFEHWRGVVERFVDDLEHATSGS